MKHWGFKFLQISPTRLEKKTAIISTELTKAAFKILQGAVHGVSQELL
jgi:hypothetical protein